MQHKENYNIEKVNRKSFNFSDYNPRKISKSAREKLKKSIKTHGLVQPIMINKRTGNIIGGHQRIDVLDEINGNQDYDLNVIAIDVDEKEEIELNILLNSQNLQGEYDPFKLKEISILFPDIDFKTDLLFDQSDMDIMSIQVPELQSTIFQENTSAVKQSREQVLEARKRIRENNKAQDFEAGGNHIDRRDNFITIVFNTNKEKYNFMKELGIDGNEKMLSAYKFIELYENKGK